MRYFHTTFAGVSSAKWIVSRLRTTLNVALQQMKYFIRSLMHMGFY